MRQFWAKLWMKTAEPNIFLEVKIALAQEKIINSALDTHSRKV